jgi:hypothetical protein
MNIQEKLFEASAELRARTATLVATLTRAASSRASLARRSVAVLNDAGREFRKVARRHAARFMRDNSKLAATVRQDVTSLARDTLASFAKERAQKKTRRQPVARMRVRKAA